MIGLEFGSELARRSARCLLLLGAAAGAVAASNAQTFNLASGNSTISINDGASGPNTAGMSSWLVDGVNQVKQQWFYYRIGDSAANQAIDTISTPTVLSQTANTLSLSYASAPAVPDYSARVSYTLTGGANGSGQASLGETVTFYNNTGSSLPLRFFDYADFDLGGQTGGQSVTMSQTSLGPSYTTHFTQSLGAASVTSSTASGTFSNSHMEANTYNVTLQNLLNGTPTGLNGNLTATGDVTAAAEWDVTLAAGQSLQLSKTFYLTVPEPSSMAVMGLGLALWAVVRRRSI